MAYSDLTTMQLESIKRELEAEHAAFAAEKLALNMARGKPSPDQLALSMPLLDIIGSSADFRAEDGTDCRNYGVCTGIPEARRLMGEMMEHDPEQVFVFGNSSLNIMYDLVCQGYVHGYLGQRPWKDLDRIKWLCPVPGYDRHFAITESFGIEMIPIACTESGPDMDEIEQLVSADSSIKGIWCVPQYSNPGGITYSDETVERLASMECAAADFRIFWDNAYCVHHIADHHAHVADIAKHCNRAGNPDRYFKFASTSKITFPGAGIAAVAASPENLKQIERRIGIQTVGYDKLNQLRHVRFLKDLAGIEAHMAKHAEIIAPKFKIVEDMLAEGLKDTGCGRWSCPDGGYFISFTGPDGTAKRTVELAKSAGVTMTKAGATWPLGIDPHDSNIRIAPTLPSADELRMAMEVFICSVKLASIEAILNSRN